MTSASHHGIERFDLLPVSFRHRDRVRQACIGWITILIALLITFIGVVAASWFRSYRQHQANIQLAKTAMPLMELRDDTIRLGRENSETEQMCRLVESAQSSDDLLQTLGSIALTNDEFKQRVSIDLVDIQLPVETHSGTPSKNDQLGAIEIELRSTDSKVVQAWAERIEENDRITQVRIDGVDGAVQPAKSSSFTTIGNTTSVQINQPPTNHPSAKKQSARDRWRILAQPRASRILP